jgi:hypothetical protein
MIIRIAVAIAALVWIHGAEQSAEQGTRAVAAMSEEAPRTAVALCMQAPGLCEEAARHVVTGAIAAVAPREPLRPEAGAIRQPPRETHAAIDAPLPPRRPASR